MQIRSLTKNDRRELTRLEREAYPPALREGGEALLCKYRASPSTCFVLAEGERVAGYVLSLPYPAFRFPGLVQDDKPDYQSHNLHLHDLVVGRRFRNRGLAKRLLRTLTRTARTQRYRSISLVAVGDSDAFWRAQGYRYCPEVAPSPEYGPRASYMQRPIDDR